MSVWVEKSLPIFILLAVVALVVARLPKIDLGYSPAYKLRRMRNWIPVGLLYAFLYMGRYNLTVSKSAFENMPDASGNPLMTNADFGTIFGIGTAIYGISFLLNGPLTDRIGGKRALLIGGGGAIVANVAMGVLTLVGYTKNLVLNFSLLYALNMYFQSFGAAAIVKINAPWFHVRERGMIGALFGILISLGLYLAFDIGRAIRESLPLPWLFFIPALVLTGLWAVVAAGVQDSPRQAGFENFDTADASSGESGPPLPPLQIFRRMLSNPVIVTIACVEFCSGFLRQAIMQWYETFARAVGYTETFTYENFGMLLCCAGITGAMVAGAISDHLFASRRGPVAVLLYGVMLIGAGVLAVSLDSAFIVGLLVVVMSTAVIGVHGMLAGTASMDFGGTRNAGTATGIIDGFVYAGTAAMAFTYGKVLPQTNAPQVVEDWIWWPVIMMPVAAIGLALALRVWHAIPRRGG